MPFILLIAASLMIFSTAHATQIDRAVNELRTEWAMIKFQTPKKQQLVKFEQLIKKAERTNKQYPNNANIMTWYGTILSTYSAIKGGLSALPHIKKARKLLESAIKMDPRVENGLAHAVIGTIYAHVPGWPVAFGNKKTARKHLETAIRINPRGMDPNFYYGDFLVDAGEYQEAKRYLEIASRAPIRKSHEAQDRGRKGEIALSMAKLRKYVR